MQSNEKSNSRVTTVLLLSVLAAVIGSSSQFGYNLGVVNNSEEVCLGSASNY